MGRPEQAVAQRRRDQGSRATVAPVASFTVEPHTLDNGLRVLLAPDPSVQAVAIVVRYDVGFRSEPEGRTGFAHLFEHLMFEGSTTLPKLEHARLVQSNGGVFNGQTQPDATVYYEQLPANALELGLFLEADRMRSVRLSEETLANQIAVVKEEILLNVINRPYGGFPWIQLPPVLYRTFHNAHNGYGSFVDLEAATVSDAASFFKRYYAPGNAVLCVVGDLEPDEAMSLIERHFADIPRRRVPKRPSFAEPPPPTERRVVHDDRQAPLPAVALGFRVPDPLGDLHAYAAAMLAIDALSDGVPSRLHQRLVKQLRLATHVSGYAGTFGDAFGQRDPVTAHFVVYHPDPDPQPVLEAFDEVTATLADGVPDAELERVVTANAAAHLRRIDSIMARAQFLAALDQIYATTELVNTLPAMLAAITPAEVAAAARHFDPRHRAVLQLVAGQRPAA